MASTTEIANRALLKLGDSTILALTDNSKGARTINGMFNIVRDAELRRHNWNFAIKRSSIPALAAAPDWGYQYQFPLPSDYLKLVQVNDYYIRPTNKSRPPWRLEGGVILTDMPAPLKIRYVSRVENTGLWDAMFVECMACKLAFEACEAITQTSTKKQMASDEYKVALSEAIRCSSIENPPDEYPAGTWLEAREGYGAGTLNDLGTLYTQTGAVIY